MRVHNKKYVFKVKLLFVSILAVSMFIILTGCEKSTSKLIKDLGSSDVKVVEEAIEKLASKGNEVVPALIEKLESSEIDTQEINIIKVLGKLKSTDAVKPVLTCAVNNSNNEEYKNAARNSIIEIGPESARILINSSYNQTDSYMEEILAGIFENYTEEYVKLFQDPDSTVSRISIHALLKADIDKSLKVLADVCRSSNISIKRQGAVVLGELKDPRAVVILDTIVNEKDRDLRKDLINALSGFKSPEAINVLTKMIGEKDHELRRGLIEAFGACVNDDNAFNALLAMRSSGDFEELQIISQYIDNALSTVPQEEISKLPGISGYKNAANSSHKLGKTIIIDNRSNTIFKELFLMLPAENRVSLNRIGEAQTMVILEWGDYSVGSYTNGTLACISTCIVKVADLKGKTILGSKKFEGGDPPFTITYYEGQVPAKAFGSDPDCSEMLKYILKFK